MAEPDVLIIGAGVTGLTLAHELARRGRRVQVVTRDAPGTGASAAAAGMLEVHYPLDMPPALRDLCALSHARYPALARALREETGVDIGLDEGGTLALAESPSERAALEAVARTLPRSRLLTREAEWQALEPLLAPGFLAALDLPDDHHVDPRRLCRALVLALERRGVPLLRGVTVSGLLTEGSRVVGAATDTGNLRARWTVNAAGAWAGAVGPPDAAPSVHPVKGQLLVLASARLPRRVLQCRRIYLVPRPRDGEILLGATVEEVGFDTAPTAAAAHDLLAEGFRIAPGLRDARHVATRVGLRPGTPDGLPVLGPAGPQGLLLAAGVFRKGVLLAPAVAGLLADIVTGSAVPPELSAFRPDRPIHADLR